MAIKRSLILGALVTLVVLSLISYASAQAVTGSIGNSRMVLKLDQGESVRKSILVKNVNDFNVVINATVSGDLSNSIELEESSFTLAPNSDQNIFFTIKATKPGTTETKVNIRFSPEEGGNGVGLSSTIIVVSSGQGTGDDSEVIDNTNPAENSTDETIPDTVTDSNSDSQGTGFKPNFITVLLASTGLLIIIFVILIIYASKRKSKKGLRRPRE
jgi:hypothetical protein